MSSRNVSFEKEIDLEVFVECSKCDASLEFSYTVGKFKDKLYIVVDPCKNRCKEDE